MTACPHCQRALPSDLTGTNCPACKKALPIALVRSVNPTFTETPALGQARPVRPVQNTPAEDRWDDAAGSAPSAKPLPGVPTSAGLPGAASSSRRGGATQVMGSDAILAAETKRDPVLPAAAPRAAGERQTDDLLHAAPVTGEHTKPAPGAQKPAAAGLPGAAPRTRGANATIVGGTSMLGLQTAPDPSGDDETNALRVEPASAIPGDSSASSDETSALRVDQLEARIPGDLPSNRPPARPAATSDAGDSGDSGDETGVLRADQLDARIPGDLPSERPPARPATTADAHVEIAPKPAVAGLPKNSPSATTSNPGAAATGPRPVLASDMLREDLVPHEPARQALRAVLALAGVVLLALAAISMRDPAQAIAWAIPGLTALAVVIAPATYGTRALLPFAPASAALLMQAIAVPGARVPAAVVFTITAGGLPAALFYRSFFRASRRARAFVAVGLLAAVVWLQLPGGGGIFESGHGSWAMAHIPALALVGVSLLSLLAFVGADTTAGCRAWATLAIAWAGFAALAQRTVIAGAAVDRDAWTSALATSALAAITALSGAALLALYSRPTAPRTGIGAAASQH